MSLASLSDLKFIKPAVVKLWFDQRAKFAVVDVRDSDYAGGHIKGCYHYPANEFASLLPDLRMKLEENKIENVVFHCALSQARGPKAALLFLRTAEDAPPKTGLESRNVNVYVMEGGFTSWARKYGEDSLVTEGFAADIWNE